MMQTTKKNWVYALFAFAVLFYVIRQWHGATNTHENEIKLSLKTIQTPAIGWGYEVYTNDTLYIRQEFKPALQGRAGFATEAAAERAGKLVIEKIRKRQQPSLTPEELDSLEEE